MLVTLIRTVTIPICKRRHALTTNVLGIGNIDEPNNDQRKQEELVDIS